MRQCEVYVHGIRAGVLTEDDRREYTFAQLCQVWPKIP